MWIWQHCLCFLSAPSICIRQRENWNPIYQWGLNIHRHDSLTGSVWTEARLQEMSIESLREKNRSKLGKPQLSTTAHSEKKAEHTFNFSEMKFRDNGTNLHTQWFLKINKTVYHMKEK